MIGALLSREINDFFLFYTQYLGGGIKKTPFVGVVLGVWGVGVMPKVLHGASGFVQNTTHPGCCAAPPLKKGNTRLKLH
jgi:hypothetical protein